MLRDPTDVFVGLRQRCGCEERPAHGGRWSISYDFNLRYELCRLCGATALESGQRYCIWFCPPCLRAVGATNTRLGGYVVPIGRHSLHAGQWVSLGAPSGAEAGQIEELVLLLRGLPERMSALEEWRAAEVQRLWARAGLSGDEIALPQFEVHVRGLTGPPGELVDGLLEHLTRPP